MDKSIRRNEICVIGLPRCDFAFSSTRSCFIAYGFNESTLEMTILRNLLEERGIQVHEAGGALAPGQNAYCAKICSKIITSQFCVVLLNNDLRSEQEVPNANVNMEYGLMLGFNKYVIPFQREGQSLPFNVAGLDTVKYTPRDLENKAIAAIDQAIELTRQDHAAPIDTDQLLTMYLLDRNMLVSHIDNEGERDIFRMGQPLGFALINDFTGFEYVYFGNFSTLRPEAIVWRLKKLDEILQGRRKTIAGKVALGAATREQAAIALLVLQKMQMWVVVTGDQHKQLVESALVDAPITFPVKCISLDEVRSTVLHGS
jgi:hypothetical protein